MAVKVVNDTAGSDSLVFTLLVFGVYLQINSDLPPSPSKLKKADAIWKAIHALRKLIAENQINITLAMRNEPIIKDILALLLQRKMLV